MAPIAPWLNLLLAAGLVADASAKPLFPGRHAPPSVANLLSSHVKKDLHSRLAEKYAGEDRGLVSHHPASILSTSSSRLVSAVARLFEADVKDSPTQNE